MRAVLLLLGVLLMPWSDDMDAVSKAIAQQGPTAQTPPDEQPPLPPQHPNWRHLNDLVVNGKITPDQFLKAIGPPPRGVTPEQWMWSNRAVQYPLSPEQLAEHERQWEATGRPMTPPPTGGRDGKKYPSNRRP